MHRKILVVSLLAFAPGVFADVDFDVDCTNCQPAFEDVVEDIGAALNYKVLAPAEAGGITGFGVGAFVNYTPVENEAAWRTLTNGEKVDAVGMAGLVASKGLPLGIDVGAFYATVPGASGVKFYGAELRYAILEGGVAQPALAVRGAYTTASGIDDFDYEAWSADVSLSKGFAFVTPYVGAGYVWATATPSGALTQAPANLRKVDADNERVFAGVRLSLGLLEMTPAYERQGDHNSYTLRLGLSF